MYLVQSIMQSSSHYVWSNSWTPIKAEDLTEDGIPSSILKDKLKHVKFHVVTPEEYSTQGSEEIASESRASFRPESIIDNNKLDVVVVPLRRSYFQEDVKYLQRMDNTITETVKAKGGRYLAIFTAANDGLRTPEISLPRNARTLADPTPTYSPTPSNEYEVRMTPGIMAGLLIFLFLSLVATCGVACLHTIQTPTKMHSVALPVGKES